MSANIAGDDHKTSMGPRSSRSFSRMESSTLSPFSRSRSRTVHGVAVQGTASTAPAVLSSDPESVRDGVDLFEKRDSTDAAPENATDDLDQSFTRSQSLSSLGDELPIELISLTDRFVDSLSAKVYSAPPSIDKLSDIFQEFYLRAAAHIATHVSALASRLHRDASPSSSSSQIATKPKRGSSSNNGGQKDSQNNEKPTVDQQMLTATEVAEKRKARKLLQFKGHALEEAVERRACESVYDKIWRHRNTLDEVRDEKLRSKTAALSLIGIGLKDLGIDILESGEEKEAEARDLLATARECLIKMNDEKFPLGKLQHLTAAHKAIVDTLTVVLPSSSSADEILPTLIYTLITTPPEGINIISNLLFIQRFRASSKLDGETAYCLTNLEAAISFLENVDLASLRAEELQAGLPKPSSGTSTPVPEQTVSLRAGQGNSHSIASTPLSAAAAEPTKPVAAGKSSPATIIRSTATDSPHQRRLSNLFQPPAKALGAANDVVRNTADQGFKTISSTLDHSFKFLFGRLKEVQMNQSDGVGSGVALVPKTLDDARRLVNTSAILDDGTNVSEDGSVKDHVDSAGIAATSSTSPKQDDRLIGLISGRKLAGERNSASTNKTFTGKKGAFTSKNGGEIDDTSGPATPAATPNSVLPSSPTPTPSTATFGSMISFGNTLNPLNHIPGMIRGLGRSTPEPPVGLPTAAEKLKLPGSVEKSDANITPKGVSKFEPPIKRFLEMQSPGELKLCEIPELLEDYKRLGYILNSLGAA